VSALGAVQRVYTRYRAIADDTLYLADGRPRAIFEVYPPNLSLADSDALVGAAQRLAVVFNSLSFPTQLLFRFVAVDLERHAVAAERAAAARKPELAAAARDYAALVRHLSRTQVLLELRVFVTFGLEGANRSVLTAGLSAVAAWVSEHLVRRAGPTLTTPETTELLDQRGEQIAVVFDAIGARPRRLDNVEIAELLYTCWCPERAGRQPLSMERRAA
jgi:hypothetical protein